jgi:hypothetical protein
MYRIGFIVNAGSTPVLTTNILNNKGYESRNRNTPMGIFSSW